MKKVRLALVGAGVIGARHLLALQQVPEIELVAIVDVFEETRVLANKYEVPFFKDTQSAITALDIDGVIVATPTEHHFETAKCALTNGVHVLIEKPIMATLEEANEIVELSRSTGLRVLVGHQLSLIHI